MMKKCLSLKKLPCLIIIIIIAIIIIIVLTKFNFLTFILPEVKYNYQEAIVNPPEPIQYIILSEYTSKGAFVPSNKVNVKIEIRAIDGKDFKNLGDFKIFIGGVKGDVFKFPIEGGRGFIGGAIIEKDDITISKDNNILTTNVNVEYGAAKEFDLYLIRFDLDGKPFNWPSSKKIIIESSSVLIQIKVLMIAILTLIIMILTLLLPKEKRTIVFRKKEGFDEDSILPNL